MLDIVQITQADGRPRSFYKIQGERAKRYPLFVVVPANAALEMLDNIMSFEDFPTMDVDALLQTAIDAMFFQTKSLDRARMTMEAVKEILLDNAAVFHDGFVVRHELENAIMMVFQCVYDQLQQLGLYALDGVLPYDYLHRRGKHAIVLQRRDLIPLD